MATGDFSISSFSTVVTLLNHLLTVSAANFKAAAKQNAKYFAYDGFNAIEILTAFLVIFKSNTDDADALQDLCDIVNIGLTRGNIREDQLLKTSKKGKERIEELAKKYNIKMKKTKKDKIALTNSTMTFTRSISVFPYVASQLLSQSSCILEPTGCKFGSDDLPAAFKHSGFASLIPIGNDYCSVLFQCYLAYMISFGRKINPENREDDKVWYAKQRQYSYAAWSNLGLCTSDYRRSAFRNLGLDSHTNYGAIYLKVANNLRKSLGDPEVTIAYLETFVKSGQIEAKGSIS
uniref:Nucleoprotein n=1 Tax=Apple rubbery wood virus 1 TaxID=2164102 RepID=A0A2S1B5M1_9VIRU|nr:capsid protein [Apple rubbery wood virus 1]